MPDGPLQIKRYPNRRFYARHASKYVSLEDIERLVLEGQRVEIRDSQTGQDLTRPVLTQIIMDRQPEKMLIFPVDMLHFILRSNDMVTDFLRDYFRHALTYLDYLQRHGTAATNLARPMHWIKAWIDEIAPQRQKDADATQSNAESGQTDAALAERVAKLEKRLRRLEDS